MFNLVNIIVIFVIFGCHLQKSPTIAMTVEYAVLGGEITLNIVITVECVSMSNSYMIMIVTLGSTYPTVPSAKMNYFTAVHRGMRCPVDMPFIGIASVT